MHKKDINFWCNYFDGFGFLPKYIHLNTKEKTTKNGYRSKVYKATKKRSSAARIQCFPKNFSNFSKHIHLGGGFSVTCVQMAYIVMTSLR